MTDQALAPFIGRSRWFGGKGRDFAVTREEVVGSVGDAPRIDVLLLAPGRWPRHIVNAWQP